MNSGNQISRALLSLMSLFLLMSLAWAQEPAEAPVSNTDKILQEVVKAPLLPERPVEDIDEDIARANEDQERADKAIQAAKASLAQDEQWLQAQKQEIDSIKEQIKLAKKEKRETDKIMLEAQKKKAELVKDFLESKKDLSKAELDLAQKEKELATTKVSAFQVEKELTARRQARNEAAAADYLKADMASADAQEKALKAFKSVEDKNKDVAGRHEKVAGKRLELFEVRRKLVVGMK
jgi:hypothetical protein